MSRAHRALTLLAATTLVVAASLMVVAALASDLLPPTTTTTQIARRRRNTAPRVAIVTTTRNPHKLDSWVTYHLGIGFHKLYIFYDLCNGGDDRRGNVGLEAMRTWLLDHSDSSVRAAVELVPVTHEWRDLHQRGFVADSLFEHYDTEVMSRQAVNAQTALQWMQTRDKCLNLEYLLHIDTDELWYPVKTSRENLASPVGAYFASLPLKQQVISFPNWEIIPTESHADDLFAKPRLFRCDMRQYRAYCGHKSAIKNDGILRPKHPAVHGVHYWKGRALHVPATDAVILHYVSGTFDEWLKKYTMLGKFPDQWFGGSIPIGIAYHKTSRDMVQRALCVREGGSPDAIERATILLEEFYAHTTVLGDQEAIKKLIRTKSAIWVDPYSRIPPSIRHRLHPFHGADTASSSSSLQTAAAAVALPARALSSSV